MPTPSHIITCSKKALLAPGVFELCFHKPEGMTFKAGQFLLFDIPLIDNPTDIQTRALSIASSPEEEELVFVIKIKPEGRLGKWIMDVSAVGATVRVQGALGLFTVKDEAELIFIATGAGIAPFRSQIKWLLEETEDVRPLTLLFGVRYEKDFFWIDQLEALAAQYPRFRFLPVLSGQEPFWKGLKGRVHAHLPDALQACTKPGVYICGAPEMVKDVKNVCVDALGISKKQVHAEGYI
jgi:ferredoxin-NADP reductase